MIRLCLVGQPVWTEQVVRMVNRYGSGQVQAAALTLTRPGDLACLHRLLAADVLLRVGYRPGAPTLRGVALDVAWTALRALRPGVRCGYFWIGTDVLNAVRDHRAGRGVRPFLRRARQDFHLAASAPLAAELAEIGIGAAVTPVPGAMPRLAAPPPLPAQFAALTYIPDGRHAFYGSAAVYAAARALPEVLFHVVHGRGGWVPAALPNLHFHGWQPDMAPFYARSTVVLRLVAHDALGGTVREGLAYGRHVMYTYPLPHTCHVPFGDARALIAAIRRLYDRHRAGRLDLNLAGRAYALAAFDEARTTRAIIAEVIARLPGGGCPCR